MAGIKFPSRPALSEDISPQARKTNFTEKTNGTNFPKTNTDQPKTTEADEARSNFDTNRNATEKDNDKPKAHNGEDSVNDQHRMIPQ